MDVPVELREGNKTNAVNGTAHVHVDGDWGVICDTKWGYKDAKVFCRQLGHTSGIAVHGSYFGVGNGPVWMENVACDGTEDNILDCRHDSWAVSRCPDTKHAGAKCFNITGNVLYF